MLGEVREKWLIVPRGISFRCRAGEREWLEEKKRARERGAGADSLGRGPVKSA